TRDSLVFNDYGKYAGIWMTYCWMALGAPVMVWAIERARIWAVLVMLAVPWVAWPFLSGTEELGYFWGFLTGLGNVTGPSVLHSTTLVIFGYLLMQAGRRLAYGILTGLLLVLS